MIPSGFDEANGTLGPPQGISEDDVSSLRVWRGLCGNQRVVISCWRPTRAEMDEIARTGRVWLYMWGDTMPPALVSGDPPMFQASEATR